MRRHASEARDREWLEKKTPKLVLTVAPPHTPPLKPCWVKCQSNGHLLQRKVPFFQRLHKPQKITMAFAALPKMKRPGGGSALRSLAQLRLGRLICDSSNPKETMAAAGAWGLTRGLLCAI